MLQKVHVKTYHAPSFLPKSSSQGGPGTQIVCVYACVLSSARLFATPWTVALQAPLSMKFSRPEYWSGLPFPTLGHLPIPGIEPESLVSPALVSGFFTTVPPGKLGLCVPSARSPQVNP